MRTGIFERFIILAALVAGCNPLSRISDKPRSMTTTTFAAVQITPTGTLTDIVPTSGSQTPMQTPARILTSLSVTNIQQKCLEVLPIVPRDKAYNGKLIFLGQRHFQKGSGLNYYENVPFFNFKTRKIETFPQYKINNIVVSPDRRKYALQDANDLKIKVFSVEGQLLATVPPYRDPWFLGEWLDSENLVLAITKSLEGGNYIIYPQDIMIVNPFTYEQTFFPSNYPNIDKAQAILMWEGGGITKYDPTRTRVVYASTINQDYIGNHEQGYVLWDLVNQKKLVEIATGNFGRTPKWYLDGSKFIINGLNGDFFTVTRDGEVVQLTNLNPDSGRNERSKYYFSDLYSWSPDGRYVALWLEAIESHASFVVMDTYSGEVTDYCISSGYEGSGPLPSIYVPVWSPDGKNVAIIANRQEDGKYDALLVDLEGGIASKLGEDIFPIGWLDTLEK